jgi:para-aminobenzoate synthetase component 1
VHDLPPLARFGDRVATGLLDVTDDPAALDSTGFWAVAADFEGHLTCARFSDVRGTGARAGAGAVAGAGGR